MVRQLEDFTRIHGVLHQLHLDVGRPAPDPKRDAALLRVLQEALSNIARHAKASQVRVSMSWSSEQLALSVADNGVGLPPPAQRRGCGLPGIFERVQALGGCLVLKSEPGAGTRLSITIPLAATGSQETAHAA